MNPKDIFGTGGFEVVTPSQVIGEGGFENITQPQAPANEALGFLGRVKADLEKRKQNIATNYQEELSGKQIKGSTNLQVAGEVGGGVADIVAEAIRPVAEPLFKGFIKLIQKVGNAGLSPEMIESNIRGEEELKKQFDAAKQLVEIKANNDPTFRTQLKNAGALTNIGNAILSALGIESVAKSVIVNAPKVAEATINAGSAVGDFVESKVTGIKTAITGKRLEEVIATKPEDVYKLSPPERKAYSEYQLSQHEAKAQVRLTEQAQKSQMEAEQLTRELQTTSRDKALEMRPKIKQALGEQSQEYRKLVDEELASKGDIPIHKDELRKYVESRYSDNPEMANVIKDRLGLGEQTITPKSGELPTVQIAETPQDYITLGDLYEQTKSLKGDIGSSAKKGTRVYTSEEKLTDDAISTLVNFMKENGVDLKNAREFWSKYAPIRDQLVREGKPFVQAPTQTKAMADRLIKVAKGTDVNNELYIKEVEDLLGEPVTKEIKDVLGKLDESKKQALANQIKVEAELENTKSALKAQSFEVERKARLRDWTKRIVQIGIPSAIGIEIWRRLF